MKSPTRKSAGILVLNSNTNSHFCPGCAEQAQYWFLNSLKIKSPQKENPRRLLRNAVVYLNQKKAVYTVSKLNKQKKS